jgi:hypothetical protein
VVVIVKDTNDNAPIFHQSLYNYEIAENTSIGEVIGTAKANDKDLGTNGQVLYSIVTTGIALVLVASVTSSPLYLLTLARYIVVLC